MVLNQRASRVRNTLAKSHNLPHINRMKDFQEMFRRTVSSPFHDQMVRFAAPLRDHFGINHFWWYRINNAGDYSSLATHTEWSEECFYADNAGYLDGLRHPKVTATGIHLMSTWNADGFLAGRQVAWNKYKINLQVNVVEKNSDGIEAFGFGSQFNDPKADERILNELPLLRHFAKSFRQNNEKLFQLVHENRVSLIEHFGATFYEQPKTIAIPHDRENFLRKMGLGWIFSLTPRERDVVNFLSSGFTASYIAEQLGLETRTVENYITNIKAKLSCSSKLELIQKAKEMTSLCGLDSERSNITF
jgi:DNA-binding CsgD family transcriptional regulator